MPQPHHDEVRLIDIWRVVARRKSWVVGGTLAAALCALAFLALVSPQWEATGVVQIGQVPVSQADPTMRPIEPAARALERVRLKSFEQSVFKALNLPADHPEAELYSSSVKSRLLPNTDLIELMVRGHSPANAVKMVEAAVGHLRGVHEQLAAPAIARMEGQLAEIDKELRTALAERERLLQTHNLKPEIGPGARFAENLVLSTLSDVKDRDIRELRRRKLLIEDQLSPARTYPTSLIDRVYVPEVAAFPRKILTLVFAVLTGLMLSVLAVFIREYAARNAKAPTLQGKD